MSYHRFVAIGDSTTEGLEDPYPPGVHVYEEHGHSLSPSHLNPIGSYRGWSDRLAVHLAKAQDQPLEYANLAIRGYRLHEIRRQLAPALAMRPDIMTIVGGVNDASKTSWNRHEARGHLAYMFRKARETGAEVLTFTMPDPAAINWMVRPLRRNILQLNDVTREEAVRYGVRLLDLHRYPVALDRRMWFEDRLHATSLGHRLIGQALAHIAGVPGIEDPLTQELPALDPVAWRARRREDHYWLREYFIPFVQRHRRGESMSHGVTPKRPLPTPVSLAEMDLPD